MIQLQEQSCQELNMGCSMTTWPDLGSFFRGHWRHKMSINCRLLLHHYLV